MVFMGCGGEDAPEPVEMPDAALRMDPDAAAPMPDAALMDAATVMDMAPIQWMQFAFVRPKGSTKHSKPEIVPIPIATPTRAKTTTSPTIEAMGVGTGTATRAKRRNRPRF